MWRQGSRGCGPCLQLSHAYNTLLIKELEMKKEVVDPIALEVKSLSKSYRNISR
jgi:hypothetical protein